MAEKNLDEYEHSRADAADHLREIADDLEEGEEFNVDIGNKTITLHPPSAVKFEVGARESSSILRGSRESVTIKMDWSPE